MNPDSSSALYTLRQYIPQGKTLESFFLEKRKEKYKNLDKELPDLYKAIFGKKYVLPQNRQADYHSAEACDYLTLDNFFGFFHGLIPRDDHVAGHAMSNVIESLNYGKPTFYLTKEQGFPLLKTPLPMDYVSGDINWKFPSFRIYLPKGLLELKRDGQKSHVMFLDICKFEKDYWVSFPKELSLDLIKAFGPRPSYTMPLRRASFDGMCVSMILDFDGPESAVGYAQSTGLNTETIREVIACARTPMEHSERLDEFDEDLNSRATKLALNILLFMSMVPKEPPKPEIVLRKPRLEGRHFVSGLYPAKFVGPPLFRPSIPRVGEPTREGKTPIPHWKSGHWIRQAHGPKSQLRKLIWVGMYHTGQIEQ